MTGDCAAPNPSYPKTAACACGSLTMSVTSPPQAVHLCTCLDCQRASGSAFSYTAFFPQAATAIAGSYRQRRRIASSGRWNDSHFCPDCGTGVFTVMEAMPGIVGIAVGCFADPDFEKPATLYWTMRRHHWLVPPPGVAVVETQ